MIFQVSIAQTVENLIKSWDVPRPVLDDVLARLLSELQTAPTNRLGREIVAPVRCNIVRFCIVDESTDFDFAFWIHSSRDNSGLRNVVHATCQRLNDS